METAIGVFTSRERAETALKELLERRVPEDAIVYLTRSETEAVALGKEIGGYAGTVAGGAVGLGAGMVAASLALIPGVGQVFALGVGAAALLGIIGKKAGAAAGAKLTQSIDVAMDPKSAEDAELFLDVLKKGRALIVVRTASREVARVACEVLDRLGVAGAAPPPTAAIPESERMQASVRAAGDGVTVLEIRGRIMLGEGNIILRDAVEDLVAKGNVLVLLDLREVEHIDSAGLGEMVRSHTALRKVGGQLKLLHPSAKIKDMLRMSMLHKVFDVQENEATAIKSFGKSSSSGTSA